MGNKVARTVNVSSLSFASRGLAGSSADIPSLSCTASILSALQVTERKAVEIVTGAGCFTLAE